MLILISTYVVILLNSYRKKQSSHLREKAALQVHYEQEILTSQLEVQNTTLQHVGQELHDNIGQLLAVVRINLNILEDSGQTTENLERIKQTNELVSRSIHDLRALSKSLDGDFVKDFGLKESIAQELQRIRPTRQFETELLITGEMCSLGFQREIVLFRITQEVLTNALKHAEASRFSVQLDYLPQSFILTLSDNGKGFDYASVKLNGMSYSGSGLRNIQRRATLIEGNCVFDSAIGNGTKVTISLAHSLTR